MAAPASNSNVSKPTSIAIPHLAAANSRDARLVEVIFATQAARDA